MSYYKLNTDGTIQSANTRHEGFSPLSELTTKEYGSYYEFYNLDGTPDLVKIAQEEATVQAQVDKQAKLEALATLTVTTTAGNEFDGDDTARSDMMAAIQASEILGVTSSNWKLADNSWKLIELAELKEALALAIQAKGTILGS